MATAEERVKLILVELLGVDDGRVTRNASIMGDLGADSLKKVELVMAFEDAFELQIPDEDAAKILTVGDVTDYLRTHGKAEES
jgi:acyl carrier protein